MGGLIFTVLFYPCEICREQKMGKKLEVQSHNCHGPFFQYMLFWEFVILGKLCKFLYALFRKDASHKAS